MRWYVDEVLLLEEFIHDVGDEKSAGSGGGDVVLQLKVKGDDKTANEVTLAVERIELSSANASDPFCAPRHSTSTFSPRLGSIQGSLSVEEVESYINEVADAFPLISKVELLGQSVEKRPLRALCLGACYAADDQHVPQALYTGMHHAREHNKIGQRKSAAPTCDSSPPDAGVDLNRNYDVCFAINKKGSSNEPCGDDYNGPRAFSEPETQAVRDLVERNTSNFSVALNYHSFGKYFNLPFACQDKGVPAEPNNSVFMALARELAHFNGFEYGQSWKESNLYTVNGETSDWMWQAHGIFAMSPEVGPAFEVASVPGFWPPREDVPKLSAELHYTNLQLARVAGPVYSLKVTGVQLGAIEEGDSTSSFLSVEVTVSNSGLRPASAELLGSVFINGTSASDAILLDLVAQPEGFSRIAAEESHILMIPHFGDDFHQSMKEIDALYLVVRDTFSCHLFRVGTSWCDTLRGQATELTFSRICTLLAVHFDISADKTNMPRFQTWTPLPLPRCGTCEQFGAKQRAEGSPSNLTSPPICSDVKDVTGLKSVRTRNIGLPITSGSIGSTTASSGTSPPSFPSSLPISTLSDATNPAPSVSTATTDINLNASSSGSAPAEATSNQQASISSSILPSPVSWSGPVAMSSLAGVVLLVILVIFFRRRRRRTKKNVTRKKTASGVQKRRSNVQYSRIDEDVGSPTPSSKQLNYDDEDEEIDLVDAECGDNGLSPRGEDVGVESKDRAISPPRRTSKVLRSTTEDIVFETNNDTKYFFLCYGILTSFKWHYKYSASMTSRTMATDVGADQAVLILWWFGESAFPTSLKPPLTMRPVSRYLTLLLSALSISTTTAGYSSSCQTTLGGSYPSAITTYPGLKDKIELIAKQQVAQWYTDRVPDIPALAKSVVLPVCSDANQDTIPPTVVVYGLPQKDCAHGFSTAGSNTNNDAYRAFLQQLADAAGNQEIVYVLEPDAIGLLADGGCGSAKGYAENLVVAMDILSQNPNAEMYLDVGYWTLSDDDQAAAVAKIVHAVDPTCKCKGISLNTSNYRSNVKMATTCERFIKASGRPYKCIVDTSRNFVSPLSDEWCNANWAGIGELPTANTGSEYVNRYVWVKPPGESDGECTGQSDRSLPGPDASVFFPEHFIQLWNNGVFVQKLGMDPINANTTSNTTAAKPEAPTPAPTTSEATTTAIEQITLVPTTRVPSTERMSTQEIRITSVGSLNLSDDTFGQVHAGGWYPEGEEEHEEDATKIPTVAATTPTPTSSSPIVSEVEPPPAMVVVDTTPVEYVVDDNDDFTRVDEEMNPNSQVAHDMDFNCSPKIALLPASSLAIVQTTETKATPPLCHSSLELFSSQDIIHLSRGDRRTMQRDECIYNLIPKVHVDPAKPERYRSKFDPKVQPTGSTFGVHGKTKLAGANLGSAQKMEKPTSARGFGRLPAKPDPKSFIRKGERNPTDVVSKKRKPPVVKRDDKPIMGLKSAKNFVTANAVETILAVPGNRARAKNEPPHYITKEDYGQVPRYLSQVKDEIERENSMIEEFVRQNHNLMEEDSRDRVEPMDESERLTLVDALKSKWDHVNAKYQKLCHNVVFDTLGKVRRKETFEKELTQLEKDIQLLERGHVVVSQNNDRY
ncbi:unnamed protein product [Phytophthora fragariaefolia]|uniref:Unnamed protein product n=1 Tax=Phytophthora fragariaefolia TaxID=1490495 RepID=A0A9W7DCK3_9STRA|nr:unnamed protein product [Phytophthora fragariaefolia]